MPIGAHAVMEDGQLTLVGVCARPDGTELLRDVQSGTDPVELGERVGDALLARGADKILKDVYSSTAVAVPQVP